MNLSYRIPTAATASEVAPALLQAVFAAAGGNADATGMKVHWNSVLHHFVQLTGLDMDSFGVDSRGYPRLKTAISGAWGACKKHGLAAASPRRTYCLSPLGTSMAMGQKVVTSQYTAAKPTPEPTPEPTPTLVVVEPKGAVGVSWNGPSGVATDTHATYEGDAYFRRLAAEQTRCFGKWSSRASACKGCPLASRCKDAQMARMAAIASTLDAQWEAKVNAPTPTPSPVVEEEATPAEPALPEGATVMPVAFETVCTHCNNVCPENSEAVHYPGHGVFHVACIAEWQAANN